MNSPPPIPHPKQALRQELLAARRSLPERTDRSQKICNRFREAFPLTSSSRSLVYVSIREEVETISLLTNTLQAVGEVVVPYCLPDYQLGLFPLKQISELKKGAYGILEPDPELRAERYVDPQSLDLAVVPGVGFDPLGNRLGYGKGYFDRLLGRLRPECLRVALAFECQLVPTIQPQPHDIPMHYIVTEQQTLACQPS
ncbi:5-formyltetrahydrofolate cyclo-ligase [Bremerella cremea]|uniref:5-formyltetrahydrofolate cyclo-ligase n=1 Tax=Bremerella cremea TaxID=1031537 RepID=UPI00131427F5|nr:5-formyltetrahydrofolate cyclo-ligase [Bremerella cremea]